MLTNASKLSFRGLLLLFPFLQCCDQTQSPDYVKKVLYRHWDMPPAQAKHMLSTPSSYSIKQTYIRALYYCYGHFIICQFLKVILGSWLWHGSMGKTTSCQALTADLIPWVEGENGFPQPVLWHPHSCKGIHVQHACGGHQHPWHTHTQKYMLKN